jgi:hypothetical protein
LTSTNTGTAGQVFAWLTSGTGYWANASALPGSQSPLVQNVNGAQYQVTNLATVQMTNLVIKGPNGSTIFREYPSQHSGFSNELQLSTFELGAGLYVGLGFANPVAWMTTDGDIVSKIGRFWGNGGGLTNVPSASNATNFWGSLSPTNLPAGIATSNYVGTFWLTMDRLTNGAPPPSVIWRPAANRPAMMSYDTFTDSAQFAPNDMGLAANRNRIFWRWQFPSTRTISRWSGSSCRMDGRQLRATPLGSLCGSQRFIRTGCRTRSAICITSGKR